MPLQPGATATLGIAPGSRVLLIASTGGHLTQLAKIATKLEVARDSTWVTFSSPQSDSLLADYPDVRHVPYVAPRDLRGVARAAARVARIARGAEYAAAISTGAGLALTLCVLPRGTRRIFVESMSRVQGPSLSGRLLAAVPNVERYTQHEDWASRRWPFAFTLLDDYEVTARPVPVTSGPLSVLVTLGTIKPYRFDALVDAVSAQLTPQDKVVWQLGATSRTDLPGRVVESMGREELSDLARSSDVVVSHAGVGTAVDLLDLGVHPLLVPRRAAAGEHIDDHQAQISAMLGAKGLATVRAPDELTRADLVEAAAKMIAPRGTRPSGARTPSA